MQQATIVDRAVSTGSLGRDRDFVLLLCGQFVSRLGDRLALVAFPWLVYTSTGSAVSTGVVLAMFTLPYVLFGALAGAVIDRSRKRTLMIAVDVLRAGLICAVPFVAPHSLAGVAALAFAVACAGVFFDPCLLALVPEVVPRDKLLRANSLLATGDNLTEILGYVAAGLVVATLSLTTTFLIDGATFLVSALALAGMAYRGTAAVTGAGDAGAAGADDDEGEVAGAPPTDVPAPATHAPARARLAAEIGEGWRCLWGHAGLRANTLLTVAAVAGVGASYPLTFLLAAQAFDGVPSFGYMEAAIGAGYLAGSAGLVVLARRVRKGLAMTIGLTLMGAGYAVLASLGSLPAVLVVLACVGAANAVALVAIDTYLQETIPQELLGRVLGLRFTVTQGVYAVGVIVAGALAATVELAWLFAACGLVVAVPALAGLLTPTVRDV